MITRTVLWVAAALVMSLAFAGSMARAEEVTPPKTAADHEALAKRYEEKAAGYHKEAAEHREMAAAYRKYEEEFRGNPTAASADAAKMAKHCGAIMKDANKLAADAEDFAKYHRMRAKELQGK